VRSVALRDVAIRTFTGGIIHGRQPAVICKLSNFSHWLRSRRVQIMASHRQRVARDSGGAGLQSRSDLKVVYAFQLASLIHRGRRRLAIRLRVYGGRCVEGFGPPGFLQITGIGATHRPPPRSCGGGSLCNMHRRPP